MERNTSNYRDSRILRFLAGSALGLALVIGYPAPQASAQDSDYNSRPDRRLTRTDLRQIATVNGYSDGFEHGTVDRRDRAGFNYRDADEYRNADSGYDTNWRMEREYQADYRSAYVRGYQDSFYGKARNRSYDRSSLRRWDNRNSPYDTYSNYPSYRPNPYENNPVYNNGEGDRDRTEVAESGAQNGYTAGYERGVYDSQQRNRPNPQGHGAYQFGMDGFNPEWGSASTYQQSYRSYFIQGYEDGFNRRDSDRRYFRRP